MLQLDLNLIARGHGMIVFVLFDKMTAINVGDNATKWVKAIYDRAGGNWKSGGGGGTVWVLRGHFLEIKM